MGQTRRNLFAAAALTTTWAASKVARAAWWDSDDDHDRDDRHRHHHDFHCFLRGTLIATPAGEQPIETLVAGDEVVIWERPDAPLGSPLKSVIQWVGSYEWDRPYIDKELMPVRILASTLAPMIPRRDLWVSQHHAIVVGDMLIEAGCLINGTTVVSGLADPLQYFHIKLDTHAIIFAEGAPCETLRGLSETPCMPLTEYKNTRGAVESHLRSAFAPWIDRRTPADVVRDQLM